MTAHNDGFNCDWVQKEYTCTYADRLPNHCSKKLINSCGGRSHAFALVSRYSDRTSTESPRPSKAWKASSSVRSSPRKATCAFVSDSFRIAATASPLSGRAVRNSRPPSKRRSLSPGCPTNEVHSSWASASVFYISAFVNPRQ
jgi:hypothetical protein